MKLDASPSKLKTSTSSTSAKNTPADIASIDDAFFVQHLSDNVCAIPVGVEAALVRAFPSSEVIATGHLDLHEFENLGLCTLADFDTPRPVKVYRWRGGKSDRLAEGYEQVFWKVGWRQHEIVVAQVMWATNCGSESRCWVIAQDADLAKKFIIEVEKTTNDPGESILVFSRGYWSRDRKLYKATQKAAFDDLVLHENLKQSIINDARRFLDSRQQYKKLGIAWRRGALFIGPPGNGKTHCVRALINELKVPSLYVRSLSHSYRTSEELWEEIFERARRLQPCALVLEDLDSLVTRKNRSYFLNQLDGFEQNHGLFVLATTNYPERIDPAIIDRPSRFDRKYHFGLPSEQDRMDYLRHWHGRLRDESGWDGENLAALVTATDGFSFAYLKELVISSVTQWISDGTPITGVFDEQAAFLARQMKTATNTLENGSGNNQSGHGPNDDAEDDDDED